jgi:hypothetical protein
VFEHKLDQLEPLESSIAFPGLIFIGGLMPIFPAF